MRLRSPNLVAAALLSLTGTEVRRHASAQRRGNEGETCPPGSLALKLIVLLTALLFPVLGTGSAWALGEPSHVSFVPQPGAFPLARRGVASRLYVDPADWPGVRRAVGSFAGDLQAVTGQTPLVISTLPTNAAAELVLIGTIGRSAAIDRLIAAGKLDVSAVRGHWEMSVTQIVENPFPGVRSALVIAGADKRGTIFGVYDLSEQIGVSPWAWWADVRIPHHATLFVSPGRYVQAEPRVKYRGIFLNDEAPSLSGWTQEKFGGFNHLFYEHVFELLLRLKANYLWPAMWGSAFNEDDPLDPRLADEYGIVVGTSHHEPMLRAQQEWKRHGTGPWDYTANAPELDSFWAEGIRRNRSYESTITVGMRGDGDLAMSPTANTSLLERIVADQRRIIAANADPAVKDPQIWALYKEVQEYYEKGMRVPDDVTLLWCDDNWGNLRRLPTAEERKRPGGAGIYYHFDYVGDPRSYKWLNTYSITKVWEQMHLAATYGADRVWIVNVGDLKPMEFPIEFFLTMARDPERWGKDHLDAYTEAWARREFGPEHAAAIAELVTLYTKGNSRRKPEQLEPGTYSLLMDHEADRIDAQWHALAARSAALQAQLPAEQQASFFELVGYPVEASATVNEMYIAAGRNRLFAKEGRASANRWADETRRLFAHDAELTDAYNHKLADGKWDHMMDQTHIGYTFWNQPPLNAMPAVQQVQPSAETRVQVFAEGSAEPGGSLPPFDEANHQTRTIDLAPVGDAPVAYRATASVPWITLSNSNGTATTDTTLAVQIDWPHAPLGWASGTVQVTQPNAPPTLVHVQAYRPPQALHGFVEDNGQISIDAEHARQSGPTNGPHWERLPGFGERLSAMETYPSLAPSTTVGAPSACLAYEVEVLHPGSWFLQTALAPSLPFQPGKGLRYSIRLDAGAPIQVDAWPLNATGESWADAVSNGVHRVTTPLGSLTAGPHALQLCRVDPGIAVEWLTLYKDHPPASYLGPPESASGTDLH